MKFSIFAFAIAFVLEDYGTFQGKLLENKSDIFDSHWQIERHKLFKKYVLELVNAAIPALIKNNDIMEGGCACISGVDENENIDSIDAILAIMSIAKHYYTDLQVMRQTDDLSEMKIDDGLAENIRVIFVGIQYLPVLIRRLTADDIKKKYLFKHERGSSSTVPGTSESGETFESAAKCYQSIMSMYKTENHKYFDNLAVGLHIVRIQINNDGKDLPEDSRSAQLNTSIDELYKLSLTTAEINSEQLRQSWYAN